MGTPMPRELEVFDHLGIAYYIGYDAKTETYTAKISPQLYLSGFGSEEDAHQWAISKTEELINEGESLTTP